MQQTDQQIMDRVLTRQISEGVAVLTINMLDYPTNLMNFETIPFLVDAMLDAARDDAIKGVIITSAKRDFIAGADLKNVLLMTDKEEIYNGLIRMQEAFNEIESCGKPFVAALNGSALGGGFEVALACHHRIALFGGNARFGLPEVMLGLLPGGGGCLRLPRMLGIEKSLKLILQGRTFKARDALKQGLVDDLAEDHEQLMQKSRDWIKEHPSVVQPWNNRGFRIPGGGPATPKGAQAFTAGIGLLREKTKGNYPSAQYAMSAVYEGLQLPMNRAIRMESMYFVKALFSKEARNIIRTGFFHINKASKGKARPSDQKEFSLKKIGIIGAGMMGAGIAYVASKSGLEVVLKDIGILQAEKGKDYSRKLLNKLASKGKITAEQQEKQLSQIVCTETVNDLKDCDLVVEAVFENRNLKAEVTKQTEAVIRDNTIFATNTSTLPITSLAEASSRPANFIGIHFFSPVDKMQLVEIIVGKQTSDYALAAAIDFVTTIRKVPIVVNDSRGFFTSRVFTTYINEGLALLEEGVPAAMIEHAATDAGMAVGPLAVLDEVNMELVLKIIRQTEKDMNIKLDNAAARVAPVFVNELNRKGKKQGAGLYDYPPNAEKHLWPELTNYFPVSEDHPDLETCRKRLLHIQALESVRCLEEGVLNNSADADIGSVLGFGFPIYSGGTISYIDFVGLRKFVDECQTLASAYGDRFKPTENLKKMSVEGLKFYPS